MKMIRTSLFLSEGQIFHLKKEASEKFISYSEIVRNMIDSRYFGEPLKNTKFDKLELENNENT